jgi:O-succinylbenzoate synthase
MAGVRITRFEIFAFTLPLRHPLPVGRRLLTARKGLVVLLTDENNDHAMGEVSPLPGLSHENVTEAEQQLVRLREGVLRSEIPDGLGALSGGFDRWLEVYHLAPSVRFGFESAVLGLLAASRRKALCHLMSENPRDMITVNGLLAGPREVAIEKADRLLDAGYRAFKLKVGRNALADDVAIVQEVATLLGKNAVLRLDANRAWDIEQAMAFAEALSDRTIDYIEEPVRTFADLKTLLKERRFCLPLALDEGLVEIGPGDFSSLTSLKAIVIKPTLFGMEKAIRFARSASAVEITPVISSAFESGIGLGFLAHMAAALNAEDIAAGLDTMDWFEEDLLSEPLEIEKGRVQIASLPDPVKAIREDMLEAVGNA